MILFKVFSGDGPGSSFEPNLSWFNPLNIEAGNLNPFSSESGGLIQAMLLGVFIFWGWESAVNLNEETEGDVSKPGPRRPDLDDDPADHLRRRRDGGARLARDRRRGRVRRQARDPREVRGKRAWAMSLGSWSLLAVVVSALASTQTTILPASRTALSMARHEAIPNAFGEVSKRFFTPVFATVAVGVLASLWYVPGKLVNKTFLFDSLTALGLMIAFYYALTGFACVIYYRREIRKTWRNFLFIGVAPLIGALLLSLPLRQGAVQLLRHRELLLDQRVAGLRAAGGHRRRNAASGRRPPVRLAPLQARAVLPAQARGGRSRAARCARDRRRLQVAVAAGAKPSVSLKGVVKQFGDFTAVDGIDLDIAEGEFFTMLGPSGCGKTTTLRMIAGFEEPTAGQVLIDGADQVALPPYKRPTNTVFQSYALFPHMSVSENVAFGLKRKKVSSSEIGERVTTELERVGLAKEANRKPSQLSGGQQQRVALARALVNLPKVLLLDEPLGALDLKLRKGLQVQLKQIQRDVGITFVYVTHDQEEALTMSDRIAVMNQGRIEQVADPEEVYDKPASTFVAGFIGVSNLMPGVVKKEGRSGEILLDSGVTIEASVNGFSDRRPLPRGGPAREAEAG